MAQASPPRFRAAVVARLEERRDEIEQTILTRVYAVSDPSLARDPAYADGLKAAVSSAVRYGLAAIEEGNAEPGPIPAELFAQVRLAARSGVGLDTVLRRYFAGYTLLSDFVMQEAERSDPFGLEDLRALAKTQAMLVDRLVGAISDEYRREAEGGVASPEQRKTECVRRLLAGELADTSALDYDLDVWHLAVIAVGAEAGQAIRDLAAVVDRRLLVVGPDEDVAWAWLGGVRKITSSELASICRSGVSARASLAVGEPARGATGWRLTHQQARAALPIAMRGTQSFTRYAGVAVLASVLQDELLVTHLRETYLLPLAEVHDGGATLMQTLDAYFATGRNVSSTAAGLGVSRQTVTNRLRSVEELLASSLDSCATQLELALQLEELQPTLTKTS